MLLKILDHLYLLPNLPVLRRWWVTWKSHSQKILTKSKEQLIQHWRLNLNHSCLQFNRKSIGCIRKASRFKTFSLKLTNERKLRIRDLTAQKSGKSSYVWTFSFVLKSNSDQYNEHTTRKEVHELKRKPADPHRRINLYLLTVGKIQPYYRKKHYFWIWLWSGYEIC